MEKSLGYLLKVIYYLKGLPKASPRFPFDFGK